MEYNNPNGIIEQEHTRIEEKYNFLKAELQNLQKRHKSKTLYILTFLVSTAISVLCYIIFKYSTYNKYYDKQPVINIRGIVIATLVGIFLSLLICTFINLFYEIRENIIQGDMIRYEVKIMQDKIEEDIFDNSLKLSYTYLDQYYHQTREQAQHGFYITVGVAVFGAALIFGGIIAMFCNKIEPSYITCAAGVATEFISAVFFYLYNKTVSSMSRYHNKLVFSQNISFALKVADSLPEEDQNKAKNVIITELLKDINTNIAKDDSKK